MIQDATTSKNKNTSACKMTSLAEERARTFNNCANQNSTQGTNATIESTRSKRSMNLTKTEVIKREESSPQSRKRKGKVGDAHITKEQSLSKKVPRRRSFTIPQQDEGSRIDFDKRDQLASRDLQDPKRKRSREATSNLESHLKTHTKPRKLTKAKNRFSPQLTNIREENSSHGKIRENVTQGAYSPIISEDKKDKSKSLSKELTHSKRISNLKIFPSRHVKSKTKKKNVNIRRNLDTAVENIRTRKVSLKDKSRVGMHGMTPKKLDPGMLRLITPEKKYLLSGSNALHALRKPTLSRKVKNRLSGNVPVLELPEVKEQSEGIQNGNGNLGVNTGDMRKKLQSKETATALKLAHDTSGFVRMALKVVEDSKNVNLKMKGVSKRKKEDMNMVGKPNRILTTIANRYKSTLESLGNKKTITAEKMIEELGAIRRASKGNVTKTGKLGKRDIGRSTRTMFKKHLKDEPIRTNIVKESSQSDVIKDRKHDARQIKLGRKTRKNIENQMKKFGLIDKTSQNQEFTPSAATKKSKSLVVSGFDRLISGAGGNKEFESALAQIVSSHDDEIGWTKEQEKALQNAYLSIKQSDGDFWHLISKEVPGRSAKECYNKFYSRHPTPSAGAEAQAPAVTRPNEIEYTLSLSDSPETKAQVNYNKVTRKQKQLEAQKTIRNILGYVDSTEAYKEKNCTSVENNHLDMVRDVESVLDRMEDEKAVILQSNPVKDSDTIAVVSHVEEDIHHNQSMSFFENVLISGVSSSSDKENNQPPNGQESNSKKLGVHRVELILKQVEHGENLSDNSRLRTTNGSSRKKKIIKANNVYLHSKDALDFGDTTLDAIQRAKQELRNVFSRTGSRGRSFFDTEADHIG